MHATERARGGSTASAGVRACTPGIARACGFTLIELTVSIVLLGIVALLAANLSAGAMQLYLDTQRRAHLADTTATALRRLQVELGEALPNSVRIARSGPVTYLEYLPVLARGHYRAQPAGTIPPGPCGIGRNDPLSFGMNDRSFSTLGPVIRPAGADAGAGIGSPSEVPMYVVVNQLGAGFAEADAYAGGSAAGGNKSPLTSFESGPCESVIGFSPHAFTLPSPSGRFHLVGRPVSYACDPATGQLLRYAGYDISPKQPTPPASTPALALDQVTDCSMIYQSDAESGRNPGRHESEGNTAVEGNRGTSRTGRLAISLVRTIAGESVRLHHELHVDNSR